MVYLYLCVFTNAELLTDSFESKELYDGVGILAKSAFIMKKGVEFENNGDEELDDGDERVNNLVDNNRLIAVTYSKADYLTYTKLYVQKLTKYLEENNPDRVEAFKKGAQEMVKFILSKFSEIEFYKDENNTEGSQIIASYWENEEVDEGPSFLYFKDGMKMEKY